MKYQEFYAPSYRAQKPDFSRCAKIVHGGGWGGKQCSRKAVCDPDENGDPTTCKQHSHAAKESLRAKQKAAYDAETAKWRERHAAPKMRAALEKIADGHNDPRSIAREVLDGLGKS